MINQLAELKVSVLEYLWIFIILGLCSASSPKSYSTVFLKFWEMVLHFFFKKVPSIVSIWKYYYTYLELMALSLYLNFFIYTFYFAFYTTSGKISPLDRPETRTAFLHIYWVLIFSLVRFLVDFYEYNILLHLSHVTLKNSVCSINCLSSLFYWV